MRSRKLKLKKEIVANLSNAESKQMKGGTATSVLNCTVGTDCWASGCMAGCYSAVCQVTYETCDPGTSCCGDTYANCSECNCLP